MPPSRRFGSVLRRSSTSSRPCAVATCALVHNNSSTTTSTSGVWLAITSRITIAFTSLLLWRDERRSNGTRRALPIAGNCARRRPRSRWTCRRR
jgi:hypothetical protein